MNTEISTTPLPSSSLDGTLRRLLGESLSAGDTSHTVDGCVPALVAAPASVDQLAAVLRACNEHGAAVVPWGGGRHMALGNIPARYDVVLRTAQLGRLLEYEPADLTVTVEAGMTLGVLQARLAGHGQFLPIDAPPDATAGGVLAAGLSGPSAHTYGLPRDWLIGCRVALADGTLIKGGGRVVKNVAGYDLPKLFVGSLGILGVIVEATFKLAPLPPVEDTLLVACPSVSDAAAIAVAADRRGLAVRAIALRRAPDGADAAFWLAGTEAAVDRTRREIAEVCGPSPATEAARTGRFDEPRAPAGESTVLRASMLPSDVPAFLERLPSTSESLAYPTTGVVIVRLAAAESERAPRLVRELRAWAADAGASVIVAAAPMMVKQQVDVWDFGGGALPLTQRMKQQFDPRDTLNPGRLLRVM
jgi:glycolate oxidase FAD binding subunit